MFRIHDVMTGYDGLHLAGLPYYSDRALVLPGTAVVYDGDILDHLAFLRDVGVGADRVIRMQGTNIVRALHRHEEAADAIRRHVKAGGNVQFFAPTRHEHDLMERLDIPWTRVFNPSAALAEEANSKSALRRLAVDMGVRDAFPGHRITVCTVGALTDAVAKLRGSDCDFVVLKRPDLASGDGMALLRHDEDAAPVIAGYVRMHMGREVIVEAGWEHVPMSVQWEIGDEDAVMVCATAQLIDGMFAHRGNIIGSGVLPGVTEGDIAEMCRLTAPFVDAYRARGYRGVCGFDLMRSSREGRMYLLECNGRVTATTYAYGIARQLRDRVGDWAAAMGKVHVPPSVRTTMDVHRALGDLLFDGRYGVLPFNIRLLASDDPQCAVFCAGEEAAQACSLLEKAHSLLEGA